VACTNEDGTKEAADLVDGGDGSLHLSGVPAETEETTRISFRQRAFKGRIITHESFGPLEATSGKARPKGLALMIPDMTPWSYPKRRKPIVAAVTGETRASEQVLRRAKDPATASTRTGRRDGGDEAVAAKAHPPTGVGVGGPLLARLLGLDSRDGSLLLLLVDGDGRGGRRRHRDPTGARSGGD
jgi:hypothetical protein